MRFLIGLSLLCVVLGAHADDFQAATILEAGTHYEGSEEERATINVIVLQMGTLKITGQYETILHGPRAASNLIVGDTVQARADGKWLYFVGPTGKTIKARIMRQERL